MSRHPTPAQRDEPVSIPLNLPEDETEAEAVLGDALKALLAVDPKDLPVED